MNAHAMPGAIPQVSDRDCLIAHFSEIAAEGARLAVQGAGVDVQVSRSGLLVSINAPVPVGPVCIRLHQVGRVHTHRDCIQSQFLLTDFPEFSRDKVPTHRYSISMNAPLEEAEHAVELILRHFHQIEQHLDACRVYLEAA